MKRMIWILGAALLITLLVVGGAWQLGLLTPAALAAEAESGLQQGSDVPQTIPLPTTRVVSDARLVPVQSAELSALSAGTVVEVAVREGDQVAAGALLLRFDSADEQVAVAQAQASLQAAEARLLELTTGARAEEIAAAEALVAAAQARVDRLALGAVPGQLAQGEAALSAASASLARLYEPADENALIGARADLLAAEVALQSAQRAYDKVSWSNEIGMLPESAALQSATIAYEAAAARLALLESGPSPAQAAAAAAEVARQQASLDTLTGTLPAELRAAEAELAVQQAQLDQLLAGTRPEAVAAAEAEVAAATAALQKTLVTLAETEVRAPFSGTVALLQVAPGEQVTPGSPLVTFADLTQWQVETEDLTELDVVRVQPGRKVLLTFDALPDLVLEGTVKHVRPRGTDNRGDIVYAAVITPNRGDARLLWNMTTVVTIN